MEIALRALRAAHAGLVAAETNKRVLLGLGLILVVAPLSGVTYQLFDVTRVDYTWYHRTWFDFFNVLCPSFTICFCLIGASLMFPQDSMKSYFLLPPLTLYVTKIIWLSMVTTNDEFNNFLPLAPYYFFMTGAIIGFILLFTFNWLTSLHFHKKGRIRAAIDGIIDLNDMHEISDSRAMVILRAERKAFKNL